MVLASGGSPGSSDDAETAATTDDAETAAIADGDAVGFDEAALYRVVRDAVEDAILGVIGTLLLVGLAFVLVWSGLVLIVNPGGLAPIGLGLVIAAGGVYLAAATLGVVPPAREWL